MSDRVAYVVFNKENGKIISISNIVTKEDTYITVPLSDVMSLKKGIEPLSNYSVQYNPKTKELELQSKYEHFLDSISVKDFIYEIPENEIDDADIQLVQDIPNTCWKIKVGNQLKKNIRAKGVNLNSSILFSVTAKGDPNILYKTLSVHVGQAMSDNYYVVPFSMPFETEKQVLSVYTARKFDTYSLTRIFNEQD